MEKGCPGKRVIRPVESTEASFKKKINPFARANSAYACSHCLGLIGLACTKTGFFFFLFFLFL